MHIEKTTLIVGAGATGIANNSSNNNNNNFRKKFWWYGFGVAAAAYRVIFICGTKRGF